MERAHRTHNGEFYELYEEEWTVKARALAPVGRERCYNTERPHQSLGWQSPMDSLLQHHPRMAEPALSQMW